jgi:prepilin-type processing-associated H-X9-DG protein
LSSWLSVVSCPWSVVRLRVQRDSPQRGTDDWQRTMDLALMHPVPTKIKLAAGNDTLSILWADGHASAYPYRDLRDRCPCASCSEGGGAHRPPSNLLPMVGVKPLKPERAELVGRYALQVFWNDGHSSGIYSFDYLRSLCPCPECEVSRQAGRIPA